MPQQAPKYIPRKRMISLSQTTPSILTQLALFSTSIVILTLLPTHGVKIQRKWSLLSSMIPLINSIYLWQGYDASGHGLQLMEYIPQAHICLGIDGVGLSLVVLTASIFPICIILLRTTTGYLTFLTLELLILCTILVQDILCFYVFFEATLVILFLIISRYPYGSMKAAYLITVYTAASSLVMLPVLFTIYSMTGSTNIISLITTPTSLSAITSTGGKREFIIGWGLLLLFGVKIPIMPVHLWLPEAHVAAPTAGSVLLAGVLLKLGGLGFIRYLLPICPLYSVYIYPLVSTLCIISFIYASISTIKQVDLKKVVAYSSIAHMSYVTLAIFTQSDFSITASTYMMVAHGLVSPGLFLLVGALYDRTHSKLVVYSRGLGITMPLFSVMFFLFTIANLSFPLFPNFIAEVLCLGCILSIHESLAYIYCVNQVLSAAYGFFAMVRILSGVPTQESKSIDLTRLEFSVLLPILIGVLWLGLKPMP